MPRRQLHPPERVADYTARGWWSQDTMDPLFRAQVARQPDRLAVVDPANKVALVGTEPRRLTWRELDREVDRLAAVLLDQGAAPGDVLAVQLPNTVELVTAYLAAWRRDGGELFFRNTRGDMYASAFSARHFGLIATSSER